MRHITVGILAHVDAGKTTLSEAMLYAAGEIRQLGRVDHKDTFLDHNAIEKERGITIFSKQARLHHGDTEFVLLDTPGHVDFSAETERTLSVLDYALLVISGSEGIQSHTKTLWQLLKSYHVPVFIFINKMDMPGSDRDALMEELTSELDGMCVDFTQQDRSLMCEQAAMGSEQMLEYYLEHGELTDVQMTQMIAGQMLFPCYFGSALKQNGVDELLAGMERFMCPRGYGETFGALVYKVTRDDKGVRLAHMKITGGSLHVKEMITSGEHSSKIDQIRLYSGEKYEMTEQAEAGMICTVKGLDWAMPGNGLGIEANVHTGILMPVLGYRVLPPEGVDSVVLYSKIQELAQEDPTLQIRFQENTGEIRISLMGVVQREILERLIAQRFGMQVTFDEGSILYKETIQSPVEGVGHYEPLRHYAEVHLLLEPLPQGSGLVFAADCREDVLDKNWQRLILTHLKERTHLGVLTGSPVTDMKITVITGRAHTKHTEGGDFRQATYRAVRQGLMKAESVLLEPVYRFALDLPLESLGRAMSDMEQMQATVDAPVIHGEHARLTGRAPVACVQNYQNEVAAYTRGLGKCLLMPDGYAPCHNTPEVVDAIGYDSEQDTENPSCSVFCSHGAGYVVAWDKVETQMHVERGYIRALDGERTVQTVRVQQTGPSYTAGSIEEDRELEAIFNRTFRKNINDDRGRYAGTSRAFGEEKSVTWTPAPKKPKCLLVDGYNVIFGWEELAGLAKQDLGAARGELMDILSNYQGFAGCLLILVFDAYKVKGNAGSVEQYHNIYVVYTKEAETADMYIEKTAHAMSAHGDKAVFPQPGVPKELTADAKGYDVTVATSDGLEQLIVMGQGAHRISSRDLAEEIERVTQHSIEQYRQTLEHDKNGIWW